ncbi:MAG: hypothetical protein GY841_08650 [FCB group bacterium]|nr:hypothetical protein [FCB group bacterium]
MAIMDIQAIATLGLFPDFPAVEDVEDSVEYATGAATGTYAAGDAPDVKIEDVDIRLE